MTDDRDRRSVLRAGAALCSLGLAGCLGDGGDGASDDAADAADGGEAPNGTDPPNGSDPGGNVTEPPNGTDTGGNGTDPGGNETDPGNGDPGDGTDPKPEPEPVSSWPMQQYDAQNTGAVPNAADVPTENASELWRKDLGAEVECSPVVADGSVYVGDVSGTVYAFDAEGNEQWTTPVSGSEVVGTPAIYEDLLLVPHDGGVDALRRDGGGSEWSYSTEHGATDLTVAGDTVAFGDTNELLIALDAKSSEEHFAREGDRGLEQFRDAPAVLGDEVITHDTENEIAAFSIEDDGRKRRLLSHDELLFQTPITLQDDALFFGSDRGIHAYEGFADGPPTKRWDYQTENGVESGLAVAGDLVYGMTMDNEFNSLLYAIDKQNGDVRWREETTITDAGGPAVVRDLVVVPTILLEFRAYDRNSGHQQWTVEAENGFYHHAAFSGGQIYFAGNSSLVAIE